MVLLGNQRSLNFVLAWFVSQAWMIPDQLSAQGSAQDYARSAAFSRSTANRVFRDAVEPHWLSADADSFWYRTQIAPDQHRYFLVNCGSGERTAAFNHEALAIALSQATQRDVAADRLELVNLQFAIEEGWSTFSFASQAWSFRLPNGPLRLSETPSSAPLSAASIAAESTIKRSTQGGEAASIRFENKLEQALDLFWMPTSGNRVAYGSVAAGEASELQSYVGHAWLLESKAGLPIAAFVVQASNALAIIDNHTPAPKPARRRGNPAGEQRNAGLSPDRKWQVSLLNNNVHLTNTETQEVSKTTDGSDTNGYQGRVWWSPDSSHFVVMKTQFAKQRQISMVESSPEQSIHSRVLTIDYAKPGDELDHPRPVLFQAANPEPILIDDTLFANPYNLMDLRWDDSSKAFSFVYNQRGHQVLRVVSVDSKTASARILVEETPQTFVCYSSKYYLHHISDDELIWMSERSGWNHIYLVDKKRGTIKNSITRGEWVVRDVVKVDDAQRSVWLAVSGIDADQDPYYQHLIRVGYDGENLVRLTEGDGDHQWSFSPQGDYLIDTYSRVDMAPRTELRDAASGSFICELERADDSRLLETGWQYPERFSCKGRDGTTEIFGIIVRPTNFDASKQYPILEAIYAGPHAAFVPKRFGRQTELFEMAELGFIVVKIDGMGTSHRSKAFHDVCWQNLGDSGFPDRIAWIKAAAQTRPEMDIDRVGIWGGSAGGQSAMRALIAHGDFYRAAVADCGCHDNRVDKIWWNEQWMGWPIGPHYAAQSNVVQAHRLQGELMLIWGELDQNVDPASTMQVIHALVKADKDFEQLIMPGVGHGAAGQRYAKRRQADFFVRKLWQLEPRHAYPVQRTE